MALDYTVTVGTTATALAAAGSAREVIVQNTGSVPAFTGGSTVTAATGTRLDRGQQFSVYPAAAGVVYAVTESGTTTVRVVDSERQAGALDPLICQNYISPTYGFYLTPPVTVISSSNLATQRVYLSYFVAPVTMTVTKTTVDVASYSATGHTYSAAAIFQEEPDGALTRIAMIEDTGAPPTYLGSVAFFTANTFTPSASLISGRRYAFAILGVFTGGAIGVNACLLFSNISSYRAEVAFGPGARISHSILSQATMPASITNAALAAGTNTIQYWPARMVP